ncbi:MAG: CDP-diacylglycerol--glycerol-3-phosphate 3-phosphatidyltransferase [Clostridia bacterium]|nr:CDP-diacylglycerol--glycerol-3-phosphate 3-phosphatidyltransferase [Clostridia bacterium]
MNLPNKLTVLRILLVPFMIAALLIPFAHHVLVAGLIFGIASITDCLDGKIARKRNLITAFGKFADPLADKILVIASLVCFVYLGWSDPVLPILVLFREFAVTSVRLVAASKGNVVAANIWGKLKTVTQMIAVIGIFVMQYFSELCSLSIIPLDPAIFSTIFFIIGEVLLWISGIFTIISGLIYIFKCKEYISDF